MKIRVHRSQVYPNFGASLFDKWSDSTSHSGHCGKYLPEKNVKGSGSRISAKNAKSKGARWVPILEFFLLDGFNESTRYSGWGGGHLHVECKRIRIKDQ